MMVHILNYCVLFIRNYWKVILIATLGVLFYIALHRINSLQVQNIQLENQKSHLSATLELKERLLKQERELTQIQATLERNVREQTNDDVKVIYKTIQNDNCANAALPDNVIKRPR